MIVHLLIDTGDAMGANAVNTMAEAVAPYIEEITGGSVELRILSNLADHRLVRARAVWKKEAIGGQEVVDKIQALIDERQAARKAKNFARADEIRDELLAKGIILKDTREGVKWSRA